MEGRSCFALDTPTSSRSALISGQDRSLCASSPTPNDPCPQQSKPFPASGPLRLLFLQPGMLCPHPSHTHVLFILQLKCHSSERSGHFRHNNPPLPFTLFCVYASGRELFLFQGAAISPVPRAGLGPRGAHSVLLS